LKAIHALIWKTIREVFCSLNGNVVVGLVLEGDDIEKQHCVVEYVKGRVTLDPLASTCWINGVALVQPTKLNQGELDSA